MNQTKTAFPLCWPAGKPRTRGQVRSRFDTSFTRARTNLIEELDRLGARNCILSTNIELRLDGLPYANRAQPVDRGAAIYFDYKGKAMAFCCDRWDKIECNIHAIALTIGALRGISRWGSGDMMESAFTGFTALAAPVSASWRDVLQVGAVTDLRTIELNYKRLRSDKHPDKNPNNPNAAQEFDAVVKAWEQAQKELTT